MWNKIAGAHVKKLGEALACETSPPPVDPSEPLLHLSGPQPPRRLSFSPSSSRALLVSRSSPPLLCRLSSSSHPPVSGCSLECLNLAANDFGTTGVSSLSSSLASCSALRDLNLAANRFGPLGMQVLARPLSGEVLLLLLQLTHEQRSTGSSCSTSRTMTWRTLGLSTCRKVSPCLLWLRRNVRQPSRRAGSSER
eukprot:503429-Hanusia_phi.AAC.1